MNVDPILLEQLPTPLTRVILRFQEEVDAKQYFRAVHRLIDAVEVLCKLYTVAGVCQFVDVVLDKHYDVYNVADPTRLQEEQDKLRTMLAAGLTKPSLGTWWAFAKFSAKVLDICQVEHVLSGASESLVKKGTPLRKAFDRQDGLIYYRNHYAHGSTPTEEQCKKDLEALWPMFHAALNSSTALLQSNLLVCDKEGDCWLAQGQNLQPHQSTNTQFLPGRVYCYNPQSKTLVDLHPLLIFAGTEDEPVIDKQVFFFYNSQNSTKLAMLNYPLANHFKTSGLKADFLSVFPLKEWQKVGGVKLTPDREYIESLTEVFKGRRRELGQLASTLNTTRSGFFVVWGPPGAGKSTLLARMIQLLRWSPELRKQSSPEVEWPDLNLTVLEFFIRRGSFDTAAQFLDNMNGRLDAYFRLKVPFGNSDTEKRQFFIERLSMVSQQLKEEERLVLVIDGLDESGRDPFLMDCMPRASFDKVIILYGSRPQRELRYGFYDELDRERRDCVELSGLTLPDTRSLLYDVVDKYALESSYAEWVLQQSEGNPLYLTLLCQGLEQGVYELNAKNVPKNMVEMYQNVMIRLQEKSPLAIQMLLLLAAAKDFVSINMLAELLEVDTARIVNDVLTNALELLYENPVTEEIEDYQLFHESLREFLVAQYGSEVQQWAHKLSQWGFHWRETNGDLVLSGDSLMYAMKHTVTHLMECRAEALSNAKLVKANQYSDQVLKLVESTDWRSRCFSECGNAIHLQAAIEKAQTVLRAMDVKGSELPRMLQYSRWMYDEPRRLYDEQLLVLQTPTSNTSQRESLYRALQLANMGQTPTDKLLLLMTAHWVDFDRPTDNHPAVLETAEKWLDEANNPALRKLWKYSQGVQS